MTVISNNIPEARRSILVDGACAIFRDSEKILVISLIAQSCFVLYIMTLSIPFSYLALRSIFFKGVLGAVAVNSFANIFFEIVKFGAIKTYNWFIPDEELRYIWSEKVHKILEDPFFFIRGFMSIKEGLNISTYPFAIRYYLSPCIRKNVVFFTIASVIYLSSGLLLDNPRVIQERRMLLRSYRPSGRASLR